jgi:hypothetical protein
MTTTTRRNLLAAAVTAPAIIGLTPPVSASATVSRSGWDRCVIVYRSVKAEMDAISAQHDELEAEFDRQCPPRPLEPKDTRPFDSSLTLREIITRPPAPGWDKYEQAKAIWSRESKKLHVAIVGDAQEQYDAALDRLHVALTALASYPVPSLALLAEKVDLLTAEYGEDFGNGQEGKHIAADVRRLAKREG